MAGKEGRRGHNEGAIYQRADGRWVGAVHLGWEGGKRRRKVVYGKTRAEVSQKVTRLLTEQSKGLPIQTKSTTVAAFLEDWMHEIVEPNLAPGTVKQYRSIINRHLLDTIGNHKLDKLTQQQVQAMLNQKLATGTSAAQTRQIRTILRAALNQAMVWDLVHRNVAALTKPPKVPPYEAYVLTPDQIRSIMATVEGERLEGLYAIATSVGLRKAELLGLRWCDIDLESSTIQVRHQLQSIDGVLTLTALKTKNSRRSVPIVGPVATILRKHRMRQIEERLKAGIPWSEEGFLFTKPDGSPYSPEALTAHWRIARLRAGLPATVRFHDIRHGALTILATRGTQSRSLMGIAGHGQISTTMQIYAHLDQDNVRTSVDTMADLYGTETGTS
jgi:integrase